MFSLVRWKALTKARVLSPAVHSGIFSAIFGLILVGPRNTWFTNVDWLTSKRITQDPRTAQVVWEFFRKSPILQWPINRVPNYADGAQTVFQSGIGLNLLGVPFKLVEFILPTDFQYYGFWIILCFFLQGYFGARLIGIWSKNKLEVFFASLLFVISPIFIHRIGIMGQYDLGAHWLLLAALFLYFDKKFSVFRWTALLLISLWISVYIVLMVIAIAVTAAIKEILIGGIKVRNLLLQALAPVALFVFSFFMLGYNEYGGNAVGTGFFRLNLASFIYPKVAYGSVNFQPSSLIVEQVDFIMSRPFVAFEDEGYNFLGISSLILLFPLCYFVFRNRSAIDLRRHLPILLTSIILLLIAASNKMVFIRREFMVPIPSEIAELRQVFRSATRFAWPLTYLLVLYGVIALLKSTRVFWKIVIVFTFVFLQFVDSSKLVNETYRHFHDEEHVVLLENKHWNSIGREIEAVRLVPTFDLVSDGKSKDAEEWLIEGRWFSLIEFASRQGAKINFGYVARPTPEYVERTNKSVSLAVQSGFFEHRAMYVFATPELWRQAIKSMPSYGRSQILDGFFLIITE